MAVRSSRRELEIVGAIAEALNSGDAKGCNPAKALAATPSWTAATRSVFPLNGKSDGKKSLHARFSELFCF